MYSLELKAIPRRVAGSPLCPWMPTKAVPCQVTSYAGQTGLTIVLSMKMLTVDGCVWEIVMSRG